MINIQIPPPEWIKEMRCATEENVKLSALEKKIDRANARIDKHNDRINDLVIDLACKTLKNQGFERKIETLKDLILNFTPSEKHGEEIPEQRSKIYYKVYYQTLSTGHQILEAVIVQDVSRLIENVSMRVSKNCDVKYKVYEIEGKKSRLIFDNFTWANDMPEPPELELNFNCQGTLVDSTKA